MRSRIVLAAVAFLFASPLGLCQGKPGDPREEHAETYDGVKLRVRYYPAAKEGSGACVILLHDYNADPEKGDWDGLARTLSTEAGLHVFRFDFRGHGQSTEVSPLFWNDQKNQQGVSGAFRAVKRSTINVSEFNRDYYYMLVNDIAAVRHLIDVKNDTRAVNARNVYIIAAGSSAPLAYLFLASEWNRQQIMPKPTGVVMRLPEVVVARDRWPLNTEFAGRDYTALILLSPTNTYKYDTGSSKQNATVYNSRITNWLNRWSKDPNGSGNQRDNSSLLVLYGDKDSAAVKSAKWYFDDLMVAGGRPSSRIEPMKNSFLVPIKDANEQAADLLGKNNVFRTEDTILKFLSEVEKDRRLMNPIDRGYTKPFRIDLPSFGVN